MNVAQDIDSLLSEAKDITKILLNSKNLGFIRKNHEEDILQNIYLEVHKRIKYYNPNKSSIRTFLNLVIKNALSLQIPAHYKKMENEIQSEEVEFHNVPTAIEETTFSLLDDIRRTKILSDKEDYILVMLAKGYKRSEIAKFLGCSEQNVAYHHTKIAKKIKKHFEFSFA